MQVSNEPIYLQLPFPPSVNSIWRGGKGGRHYLSARYKQWRDEARIVARQQSNKRIAGAYKLQIHAKKPDRRKRDLDNIIKALSDLIVLARLVDDDSECQRIEIEWIPQNNSPVSIWIFPSKPISE